MDGIISMIFLRVTAVINILPLNLSRFVFHTHTHFINEQTRPFPERKTHTSRLESVAAQVIPSDLASRRSHYFPGRLRVKDMRTTLV